MARSPEPNPPSALQRLHDARREQVRTRFFEALAQAPALRLRRPDADVVRWKQLCDRILDVVFDRNDFFQQITPEQAQVLTDEILKDMRDVGLGGKLAVREYTAIADIAATASVTVHAPAGQRAKLHRAQQLDSKGIWRNPNGEEAPHYERGIPQTVSDMIEEAHGEAASRRILVERFKPMFDIMDKDLDELFWKHSDTKKRLTAYAQEKGGHSPYAVLYAMRLNLVERYGVPTPADRTSKFDKTPPREIVQDLLMADLYNVALANTLHECMHLVVKSAYAKEMQSHRDIGALADPKAMLAFEAAVEKRAGSGIKLYSTIAEENLSAAEFNAFKIGRAESIFAIGEGFEAFVRSFNEIKREGGQQR